MSRSRILHAAVLSLALAGCNGGESNVAPPTPLKYIKTERHIKMLWRKTLDKVPDHTGRMRPVVYEGKLYAAGSKGELYAYDATSGNELWASPVGDAVSTALTVGGGKVLLATRDGRISAFDPATGKPLWSVEVNGQVLSPPAVDHDMTVVQTIDGRVLGLSLKDGKQKWKYERTVPALSLRGSSGVLVIQGMAVVGFASGHMVGIEIATGRVVWERAVAYPSGRSDIERLVDVDAPPVIRGYLLFAVSYQGKLIAVDLRSGQLAWSRPMSVHVPFTADSRNLYLINDEDVVLAIDQVRGSDVWVQSGLKLRRLAGLELASGALLLGDYAGYVHLLNPIDGKLIGRRPVAEGQVLSHIVAEDNTVYTTAADGTLAALEIEQ